MAPVALDGLRFVMSDFERALSEWRSQEARKSSLSPCELDELEDHLRARVDLELELDVARAPSEAFALACEEVGDLGALSKEFARAGAVRWRRLLSAGWALFGVSCFLPLWTEATWPYLGDPQHLSGWQAFLLFLADRGPLETVFLAERGMVVAGLQFDRIRFRGLQLQPLARLGHRRRFPNRDGCGLLGVARVFRLRCDRTAVACGGTCVGGSGCERAWLE